MSSIKDDEERFDCVFHKVIEYQAAICVPLFLWLAMVAEPLVIILLTDKWIAVVPVLQILCIGRILVPSAYITEQVINAKGRSDLFFRQQVVKMIVKLSLILSFIHFGLIAVAVAEASYTFLQFFITNHFARKLTGFLSKKQLILILPYISSAALSTFLGYLAIIFIPNKWVQLVLALIVAAITYFLFISIIFHKSIVGELFSRLPKVREGLPKLYW